VYFVKNPRSCAISSSTSSLRGESLEASWLDAAVTTKIGSLSLTGCCLARWCRRIRIERLRVCPGLMSSGADTDSDHQRRRRAVRSNRRGRPGRRQEDDEDENKEQGCCSASSCGLSVHVAILLVFVLCVAGLGGYVRYWYVRGLRTTHTHTLQPSTGLERPYDRGDRGAHVEPEHTNLVLEFSGMDRKKLSDVPMPNLIMTKVHKVGGSTLGGVLRRISHNRGVEGYSFGMCMHVYLCASLRGYIYTWVYV
jgi:hypothetical protein